jgi:hypothetical protein
MTTKEEVNLETYRKNPRQLKPLMKQELLKPSGDFQPILEAVINDPRLRLEIRDQRFNVYYKGGSLMRISGSKPPWTLEFDKKYFKGKDCELPTTLPKLFLSIADTHAWITAFPGLMRGMDAWFKPHSKSEKDAEQHPRERIHCQAMATANSNMAAILSTDYLVLDLEYQWAHRRFDMVAAKRHRTVDDTTGWVEPDLVFIEVKSEYSACSGTAGLGDHASDYRDIIKAKGGKSVLGIKQEFKEVITQKTDLGLLDKSFGFKSFSLGVPELLIVFVNIDPNASSLQTSMQEVQAVAESLGNDARIRFMQLVSPNYVMTAKAVLPMERPIAESK